MSHCPTDKRRDDHPDELGGVHTTKRDDRRAATLTRGREGRLPG